MLLNTFNLSSVHIRVSSAPFGWKARCTRATPRQPTAFRFRFENTGPARRRFRLGGFGGLTDLHQNLLRSMWRLDCRQKPPPETWSKCSAWPHVHRRNHLTSTSSVVCFCSVYETLKTAILSSHSRLAPSNKGSLRASHASSFGSRIHNVSQHNSDRPDLTDTVRLSRGTLACIHAKDCSWCGRSGRSKPVGISACRDWVSSLVNEKAKQKSLKSLNKCQHVSTWAILLLTFSKIIELPGLLEKAVLVILVLELLCFKPFLNAFGSIVSQFKFDSIARSPRSRMSSGHPHPDLCIQTVGEKLKRLWCRLCGRLARTKASQCHNSKKWVANALAEENSTVLTNMGKKQAKTGPLVYIQWLEPRNICLSII